MILCMYSIGGKRSTVEGGKTQPEGCVLYHNVLYSKIFFADYLIFHHVLPYYCPLFSFPFSNAERSFSPTSIHMKKSASIQP